MTKKTMKVSKKKAPKDAPEPRDDEEEVRTESALRNRMLDMSFDDVLDEEERDNEVEEEALKSYERVGAPQVLEAMSRLNPALTAEEVEKALERHSVDQRLHIVTTEIRKLRFKVSSLEAGMLASITSLENMVRELLAVRPLAIPADVLSGPRVSVGAPASVSDPASVGDPNSVGTPIPVGTPISMSTPGEGSISSLGSFTDDTDLKMHLYNDTGSTIMIRNVGRVPVFRRIDTGTLQTLRTEPNGTRRWKKLDPSQRSKIEPPL